MFFSYVVLVPGDFEHMFRAGYLGGLCFIPPKYLKNSLSKVSEVVVSNTLFTPISA